MRSVQKIPDKDRLSAIIHHPAPFVNRILAALTRFSVGAMLTIRIRSTIGIARFAFAAAMLRRRKGGHHYVCRLSCTHQLFLGQRYAL